MYLKPKSSKIKTLRKKQSLSMHKLSLLATLSPSSISRIEKLNMKTHHLRAEAIAKALKCNIWDIFENTQ